MATPFGDPHYTALVILQESRTGGELIRMRFLNIAPTQPDLIEPLDLVVGEAPVVLVGVGRWHSAMITDRTASVQTAEVVTSCG
jgi:hypothetical protein